jgi:hypothetical protein
MATIPSLALIPSGYKASKVYSVLPTDGTGDFTFTRSGNATRVNSEGLIELVTTNVPRLNYPLIDGVVNGCPSLLLEPSRTNLVTFSEQFDNAGWTKQGLTITANSAVSPDGYTNADLLDDGTSASTQHWFFQGTTLANSTTYTLSLYAKYVSRQNMIINIFNGASSQYVNYNIQNGTIVGSTGDVTASITSVGNGWYRLTYTRTMAASGGSNHRIGLADDTGSETYTGSNKQTLIYGCQIEAGTYATSYIPTTTTTATRSAETCNNAGDVNTFNDSEGVLFAEISYPITSVASGNKRIAISDTTSINRVLFAEIGNTGFSTLITSSGSNSAYITADVNNLLSLKTAVKYKQNNFALWINGFEVGTDTSGNTPIGLSELAFDGGDGTNNFYGNTKQIQYFNTALNDSDLETLTSWDSFSDMATSQLYTIE